MLNTTGDILTEVLVRNNRSTTDGFITDQMLQDWTRQAHKWATAYHKWPFTEGRISTTYTTGGGQNQDEWFFEGYKSDSMRIMQIGGKRMTKLNFEDYQIQREEEPSSTERVFTDFGRTVFINPNSDVSGTLVAYVQYEPLLDSTDLAATTIFSNYDEEGNEALVEKISGYLKRREHMTQEAELHDQRAAMKLEEIWKRVMDEQYAYKSSPERGGMWERIDVLNGDFNESSENQF